jgi:hypothetical protein
MKARRAAAVCLAFAAKGYDVSYRTDVDTTRILRLSSGTGSC